tara:strand:+ start:670 stop:1101 length:432 start_codon:yes stop_codon:yes gene_type:complete
MSNESFRDIFLKKMISDYNNHLSLEKNLQGKLDSMTKIRMHNTVEYRRLFEIKTEQSYFVSYLIRIIDHISSKDEAFLLDFSNKKSLIKGIVNTWKKNDIKGMRKRRKELGSKTIDLMKKLIGNSVSKVENYLDFLEQEMKGV